MDEAAFQLDFFLLSVLSCSETSQNSNKPPEKVSAFKMQKDLVFWAGEGNRVYSKELANSKELAGNNQI